MQVSVRPAVPGDIFRIADFQVRMAAESEGVELDLGIVSDGVRAVFLDPFKGTYWVAEVDGNVVGVLLTTPEWSDWRNGYVLWLQSVYVEPQFRRHGVFSALYDQVRAEVEEADDLLGIRLYADQRNTPAHAAYEGVGMARDHYFMYEWMKGR
ncbi:MAG: GNAT family N-acetyltransferase [Dehalococcoidia bacterium]